MQRMLSHPARSLVALVFTLGLFVAMVGQVFAAAPAGYVEVPLPNSDFELGDGTGWSFDNTMSQMQGQAWAEGPDAQGFIADEDPLFDDIYEGEEPLNGMPIPNMQGFPGDAKLTNMDCIAEVFDLDSEELLLEWGEEHGQYSLVTGVMSILSPYGTSHCPSVAYAFNAKAGDLLSFDWISFAVSVITEYEIYGDDILAYGDIFALVVNTDTGDIQQLFHTYLPGIDLEDYLSGSLEQPWNTFSGEISSQVCPTGSCNLEFVFINGAYNPLDIGNWLIAETAVDNLQLFSKLSTAKPADVYVVITTDPTHAAAAGDVVTYTVTVFNNGEGGAKNATVTLPFNPDVVEVLDATFDDADGWVSDLADDSLTFQTGPLSSKDGTVVATIRMRVKDGAPLWTLLTERAFLTWTDWADDGEAWSNQPIVQVAQANDERETHTMLVEPGTDGHILFSSGVFAPHEPVGVWYNTPDGGVVAGPTYYAEEDGSLAVDFNSNDLPAGNYSMVFYGHWTEFTVVGAFSK